MKLRNLKTYEDLKSEDLKSEWGWPSTYFDQLSREEKEQVTWLTEHEDDLNSALVEIQDMIEQETGDVASIYFSGYDDPEEEWKVASPRKRLKMIEEYLKLEDTLKGLGDEE